MNQNVTTLAEDKTNVLLAILFLRKFVAVFNLAKVKLDIVMLYAHKHVLQFMQGNTAQGYYDSFLQSSKIQVYN